MVVLRRIQWLLLRLKQFDDEPSVWSTTQLGDWYGDVLHMGATHALIFISERSRLPVFIPIREANRLRSTFPEAVCRMIGAVGVPAAEFEHERSRMSEIASRQDEETQLLGHAGRHVHWGTRALHYGATPWIGNEYGPDQVPIWTMRYGRQSETYE